MGTSCNVKSNQNTLNAALVGRDVEGAHALEQLSGVSTSLKQNLHTVAKAAVAGSM